MIAFMSKHYIEILNPIPTKPELLEKTCKKKKLKKKTVVIDPMADKSYLFFSTVVLNNYIESYRNDME